MEYYITFRSITFAQRGEATLRRRGIRCALQRTPRWMESRGCGYCLKMDYHDIGDAVTMLNEAAIPYRKVYVKMDGGQLEELIL